MSSKQRGRVVGAAYTAGQRGRAVIPPRRAHVARSILHSARSFQGTLANAQRHAGHSREASTAFSEACTAFLRIKSRIGANAFEHFRRAALRSAPNSSRCQRDMSSRISLTAFSLRCFAVMSRLNFGFRPLRTLARNGGPLLDFEIIAQGEADEKHEND